MLRNASLLCLSCLLLALGAGVATPAPALASRNQITFFEAPRDLMNASTRTSAEAQLQSLGVRALRVVLYWHDVAPSPDSRRVPVFKATDPTAYQWGQYDAVINDAHRLGWTVLLTVSGPVPKWATASKRDLVTRPDPSAFGQFMTAVGRRYGSEVSLFSIWNEPNHPQFLDPQYVGGQPASPRIYRALFQYGYKGLQAAGLKDPKVLMGETAPTGTGHDVAPLVFLRGALCLTSTYRKASSCSALPAYGYAHHAYTKPAGPFYVPPNRDDVTIGVLGRLSSALDRAARAGAIRRGMPIYLTEFGFQSKPNPYLGLPLVTQAEYDAIAEHIAYETSRVVAFSQYLLRDDAAIGKPGSAAAGLGNVGFQTGLELANGRPKPSYAGFRLPLVVHRGRGGYSLWGLVRPASGATSVTVLVLRPRARSYSRLAANVPTNRLGYWTLHSGTAGTRWEVQWREPGGTVYTGAPTPAY
jgi:hypothetical protein